MKKSFPLKLEAGRVRHGLFASRTEDGGYGCFFVTAPSGEDLKIVSTPGDNPAVQGWEHVSVSCRMRCPTWEEMCFVKDLFWCSDEAVVQFHPPRADYINNHPFRLHLFKPTDQELRLPPTILVGVRDVKNPTAEESAFVAACAESR
jgi:hypothetical protein